MKRYLSRYDRGPGPCGVCGRKLDSSDSYSVKPGATQPVCIDCDLDKFLPQKSNEE